MTLLVLIGICLFVGLVLYLPFWLWFRHRRGGGRPVGGEMHVTAVGYVFYVAQVVTLFGGYAVGAVASESWLGSLTQGTTGLLRWTAFVVVVSGVVEMVLRRAGLTLQRRTPSMAAPTASEPSPPHPFRRRWKLATVRDVPLYVHASLPIGGLLIACVARAGLLESVGYCLSFVVLIAVHEFGHFAAARVLGLRVFAIDISGLGGSCSTQVPRSVMQTFVLYSAGLAAQAALLVLTLATVAILGAPQSPVGRSVLVTFTVVNLVIAVINLVPGKVRDDLSTDGAILWELFLHVFGGRPHPLAKQHATSPVLPPETQLLTIDGMTPAGFTVGIELLNDDSTPMEFVIGVLEKYVKLDREAAIASMLHIHSHGGLLLSLADRDQAEEVAGAVTRDARDQGYPLMCRAVEAQAP